jgi:bilin biosynthesis protein
LNDPTAQSGNQPNHPSGDSSTGDSSDGSPREASDSSIYSAAASPDSPEVQAKVDQLIKQVNQQIELLTLERPDPSLLRQMVQCLVDPRRATRLSLIDAFGQIGEPATPFLLEGLASHPEPVVRRACCNALTNIGDPASVDGLVRALLKDDDIGVKSAAAGALAKVGAPAFDSLRAILASEKASESCKGHAAWAMASMGSEVSERLYRIMSDPSPAVRTAVVGALAQLAQKPAPTEPETAQKQPDPAGVEQSGRAQPGSSQAGQSQSAQAGQSQAGSEQPPQPIRHRSEQNQALVMLTEALSDHSPEVRIEAAANLARLNYQKAYQPLVACLKDRSGEVRKAAAMALAKLGNPKAIEALIPLQRDAEESVQRVAALAIAQLEARNSPENQPNDLL